MLSGKNGHGLIKDIDVIKTALLGAFSFIVNNTGAGQVVVFKARLLDAVGQIDVLTIHKEVLIQ